MLLDSIPVCFARVASSRDKQIEEYCRRLQNTLFMTSAYKDINKELSIVREVGEVQTSQSTFKNFFYNTYLKKMNEVDVWCIAFPNILFRLSLSSIELKSTRTWIGSTKICWSVGRYRLHDLLILCIHRQLIQLDFLLRRTANHWRWWRLELNLDIIGLHLRHNVHQTKYRFMTFCAYNHMRFRTINLGRDA